MLAAGGQDKKVKIFDKREFKIVQTFDDIHTSNIYCLTILFLIRLIALRLDRLCEMESKR